MSKPDKPTPEATTSEASPKQAPAPAAPKARKAPATRKTPATRNGPEAKQPAAKKPKVAAPAKKPEAVEAKPAKVKLVRDTFTFPEDEYAQLALLKRRALAIGLEVKKSELVRAGLALLAALDDESLQAPLGKVERLKTGRPKK